MAAPLPLKLALRLKEIKHDNNLSYAQLGQRIGLSGTMLSSRIVHCQGNQAGLSAAPLSRQSLALIEMFVSANDGKKRDGFDGFETSALIAELKRRGATSVIF